jgi:hypothetical protein
VPEFWGLCVDLAGTDGVKAALAALATGGEMHRTWRTNSLWPTQQMWLTIAPTIDGSSFSGLLTPVEIGHIGRNHPVRATACWYSQSGRKEAKNA